MRVQGPASGSRRPELDALATNRALAMPLLPTLATAVVIASLSLLCRQPSAPEPAAAATFVTIAASASADTFLRPVDAVEPGTAVPATIAFGQLYPLTPNAAASAGLRPSTARLAARRGPKRDETVRSAANPPRMQPEPAPLPFRETVDQGGDALPDGALPFVPTAATVVERVHALGSDAVSIGGSVLGALPLFR